MTRPELELLSMEELRQKARERGVVNSGRKGRKALIEALLEAGNLEGAQVKGMKIRGAEVKGTELIGAEVKGAEITGAEVKGTELIGAEVKGTEITAAEVKGTELIGAEVKGAEVPGPKVPGPEVHGAEIENTEVKGTAVESTEDEGSVLEAEEADVSAPMFIDRGPPLPPRTDTDYLDVLVKDPWTIAALWELSDRTRNAPISDGSGRPFLASTWTLRILGRRGEILASPQVDWTGDWWVTVPPETAGIACLGAESPSGRFCPVLWSQPFNTPRARPAPDRTVRWLRVELKREVAPAETLVRGAPQIPAAPGGDLRLFGLPAGGLEPPESAAWTGARAAASGAGETGEASEKQGPVPPVGSSGASTLPARPDVQGVSSREPSPGFPGGTLQDIETVTAGESVGPRSQMRELEDAAQADGLRGPIQEAGRASASTRESVPRKERDGWRVQPVEAGPVSAERVEELGGFELPPGDAVGSSERLLREHFRP